MTEILKSSLQQLLGVHKKYNTLKTALEKDSDYLPVLTLGQASKCFLADLFILKKGQGRQLQHLIIDTSFDNYLQKVIMPEVNAFKSKHPNHSFDDRKFRLHDFYWKGESLVLELGPTMYQEYQLDSRRSKKDALALMEKGIREANTPYHYFAKNLGITVVVASIEGSVFLGERAKDVDYAGVLGFVGGNVTFHKDLAAVDFEDDIRTELEEEIGLEIPQGANIQFIGMVGNTFTSEMDLMFFYQSNKPNIFFENCKLSEHQRLVGIHNKQQGLQLLQNGLLENEDTPKKLMYPTQFGLEYLVENHWK